MNGVKFLTPPCHMNKSVRLKVKNSGLEVNFTCKQVRSKTQDRHLKDHSYKSSITLYYSKKMGSLARMPLPITSKHSKKLQG